MIKKIIFSLILFFVCTNVNADLPYYLDFKHILNKSEAGKKAQDSLKNKLDNGINQLKKKEFNIFWSLENLTLFLEIYIWKDVQLLSLKPWMFIDFPLFNNGFESLWFDIDRFLWPFFAELSEYSL